MGIVRINQHQNFLYYTDLEPDDVVSIMIFVYRISQQAKQSITPIKLAFLVGEGDSAIKIARMQKLINEYKEIGLLQNTEISLIQGYSDYSGAQKEFLADGEDLLSTKEINEAKQIFPNGSDPKTKQQARSNINQFLTTNPNTLVISLKPMRELQDIANENNMVFNQHVLACTGSYNFRSICSGTESEEALQKKLVMLLNSFSRSYIYETYSTTETNSTSSLNATEFFNLVTRADKNTLLGKLKIFIDNWKNYLLENDRKVGLLEVLKKLNTAINEENQQAFKHALNGDFTENAWKLLRPIIDEGQKKYVDNKELLSAFQKLGRLLGKWKNITQAPMQIVNADPGLLAVLTGDCDAHLCIQPVEIAFQGQFTILKLPEENKTESCRTFVYLPGAKTTLTNYLQLREQEKEQKTKPKELQISQEDLLNDINRVITTTGIEINALTMSHQQKLQRSTISSSSQTNPQQVAKIATAIRMAGGSPIHLQQPANQSQDSTSLLTPTQNIISRP